MSVKVPVHKFGTVIAHALVDDEDAERVLAQRWFLAATGYVIASIKQGKGRNCPTMSMHRFVLGLYNGDGGYAHHRNKDKLDNRRDNLHVFATNSAHLKHHWRERKEAMPA